MVFFLAFALPMRLSAATFYVAGASDSKRQILQGEHNYRLNVPANVPARQYWAITAYALDTAALIRDMPRPRLDS